MHDATGEESETTNSSPLGLTFIDFSEDFARTIAIGFRHSFFWCAAAGIYLLLRRDCDETELDEVYLEDLDPDGKPPSLDDLAAPADTTASVPSPDTGDLSAKTD